MCVYIYIYAYICEKDGFNIDDAKYNCATVDRSSI